MATEYTSLLGLALPVTGELSGTWGDTVNDGITALLDTAVAGTTTLSSDADVTLTTTEGSSNQARAAVILWTASGTTTRNITAPAQSKAYVVINATGSTQSIVIRGVGPTAGVTVPAGKKALVAWNGSDFVSIASTSISLTSDVTGTLPVANGGTGSTSLTLNNVVLGNGTSGVQFVAPGTTGNILTSNGTTWQSSTPNVGGTVTSVSFSGGTTGLSASGGPITSSGTLTLSGTLAVANGGTGATSLTANYVLLGNGTSTPQQVAPGTNGNVLMSTGSTWASVTPGVGGTVTSVAISGGTTGLTTSGGPITTTGTITLSGTLAVANGGTGVTTSTGSGNNVLSTSPTLVTPALGTPSAAVLTNATGLPLTTGVTGTLPVANGGTGVTTSTGSGNNVLSTSPVLVTPQLGTPASGILTNATGLPLTTGITGTLAVGNGGTGATSLTANNVILGNGTSAVQVVAPSTSGNVLTSNGTTWQSTAPTGLGWTLLLSTAISGTPTSVTFSSTYINNTYDDYMIVVSGVQWGALTSTEPFFNTNNTGNLNYELMSTTGGTTTNTNGSSVSDVPLVGTASVDGTYFNGILYLFNVNATGNMQTGYAHFTSVGASSAAVSNYCAFSRASGSAITSATISGQGMNYGHINLYGLKKS